MLKTKSLESFSSKKFDSNRLSSVLGGAPIYGAWRTTGYGSENAPDVERNTTNPVGYPEGTRGTHDDLTLATRPQ